MKKTLALLLAAALLLSCAACTGKVAPKQEGPIETTPAPGNSQQTDLPSGNASGGEAAQGGEAGGADYEELLSHDAVQVGGVELRVVGVLGHSFFSWFNWVLGRRDE